MTGARVRVKSRAHTRARLLWVTSCAVTPRARCAGATGRGNQRRGRAERGSSEGWFSAPSLSRSALALLRRAEVGVAPWKEDRDARGGSRVAAGAIRLRPKVSAAKFTHARNPRGVSHRDGPIRSRVSRFGSSPVLTVGNENGLNTVYRPRYLSPTNKKPTPIMHKIGVQFL